MEESLLKSFLKEQLISAKKQLRLIGPHADDEELHRFRVALRRFRSVLNAYTDKLYAPDAVVKSMVKVTNPLRETDVFLSSLEPERYPVLHRALSTFREKQYETVWKPDTVKRFEHALDALISDLSAVKLNPGKKQMVRIGESIYDAARKAHRSLTKDSKEKRIHETRLRYKQARYVLEFLDESALLEAGKKIKKAKKAQDHFGGIQDAANQLEWLRRFCEEHPSDECSVLYDLRKKMLKELKKSFKI